MSQTTTDVFQLDGPSFDELLNRVIPTVAKRYNNMGEAVTLSQHLSFTLSCLANVSTFEDDIFFNIVLLGRQMVSDWVLRHTVYRLFNYGTILLTV